VGICHAEQSKGRALAVFEDRIWDCLVLRAVKREIEGLRNKELGKQTCCHGRSLFAFYKWGPWAIGVMNVACAVLPCSNFERVFVWMVV
jgi:hypothetical protein